MKYTKGRPRSDDDRSPVASGTADEQVDYSQSTELLARMEALGNACELVTLGGARHGMGSWGELEDLYIPPLLGWLAKTLPAGNPFV